MFKSILFLYLVLSFVAIDIHAGEMASFLDEDFLPAMLNDRPTTVGGVFNVFIRFADVTCDDSGECSEEDNRGALSAAVFASAGMADNTSELFEPDIWQTACYSFRLLDDLDAGEADAAGEAVVWRAAAHLRHIYDPTRRALVSCASPADLQLALGWPAGFVPGEAADKREPTDEGGNGEDYLGGDFDLEVGEPQEAKSTPRETFGFEPIHTVAIVASYRATLAGGLPVVVMDVYWKIPVPTRFGFSTVTQASQIEIFEQVLACNRGELPGCASQQKPLRLCPASSGCQHPFLFGGSTSTWAGLQPRPLFDTLAE